MWNSNIANKFVIMKDYLLHTLSGCEMDPFKFYHFACIFQEHSVSNGLNPDVGPDLGPNCLQRLSADD